MWNAVQVPRPLSRSIIRKGKLWSPEYCGSRHCKDPSDGESGTIKRQATDAVLSRKAVISDAHDFTFVRDNY